MFVLSVLVLLLCVVGVGDGVVDGGGGVGNCIAVASGWSSGYGMSSCASSAGSSDNPEGRMDGWMRSVTDG